MGCSKPPDVISHEIEQSTKCYAKPNSFARTSSVLSGVPALGRMEMRAPKMGTVGKVAKGDPYDRGGRRPVRKFYLMRGNGNFGARFLGPP